MVSQATAFPNGIAVGSNGAGLFDYSGVPANGTNGTLAGIAGPGSIVVDRTNSRVYRNVGTLASPSWRGIVGDDGQPSRQNLRFTGNVVAAEGFTIGTQLFRFAVVNTDSTKTVTGTELASSTEAVTERVTMAGHGLVVGDLVRVDNEIMAVNLVWDVDHIRLLRAVSGTTEATHSALTAIFREAVPGTVTGVNVGLVATLTPTAATPAAMADVNNPVRHSAAFVAANPDVNTLVFMTADSPGGVPVASVATPASTETLTNAAFDNATFIAGRASGSTITVRRAPTAAEVTAGKMHFGFPFVPVVDNVRVQTRSTLALKVWDGASSVAANVVTIDNAGATDWATTDDVFLTVIG